MIEPMQHDDADDPTVRLTVRYLSHALWMVQSGQYRGTARRYMENQRPSPIRDGALRLLDLQEAHERQRSESASQGWEGE